MNSPPILNATGRYSGPYGTVANRYENRPSAMHLSNPPDASHSRMYNRPFSYFTPLSSSQSLHLNPAMNRLASDRTSNNDIGNMDSANIGTARFLQPNFVPPAQLNHTYTGGSSSNFSNPISRGFHYYQHPTSAIPATTTGSSTNFPMGNLSSRFHCVMPNSAHDQANYALFGNSSMNGGHSASHGPLTSARQFQQNLMHISVAQTGVNGNQSMNPTFHGPTRSYQQNGPSSVAQTNYATGNPSMNSQQGRVAIPSRPCQHTPVSTSAASHCNQNFLRQAEVISGRSHGSQNNSTMATCDSINNGVTFHTNIFSPLMLFRNLGIVKPLTLLVRHSVQKYAPFASCMNWCNLKCRGFHIMDIMTTHFTLSTTNLNTLRTDKEAKLLLRFCAILDPAVSLKLMSDNLPRYLKVKVNGGDLPSPKTKFVCHANEPHKVLCEPWDITHFVRQDTSNQNLEFSWIQEPLWSDHEVRRLPEHKYALSQQECQRFAFSVELAHRMTTDELIKLLQDQKQLIPRANTAAMIANFYSDSGDEDVQLSTKLQVSLICPLGKNRVEVPCLSVHCNHLQIMDASNFIRLKTAMIDPLDWTCSICNKSSMYNELRIVEFFAEIINSPRLPALCSDVQLNKDGTWDPVNKAQSSRDKVWKPRMSRLNDSVQILEEDEGDDSMPHLKDHEDATKALKCEPSMDFSSTSSSSLPSSYGPLDDASPENMILLDLFTEDPNLSSETVVQEYQIDDAANDNHQLPITDQTRNSSPEIDQIANDNEISDSVDDPLENIQKTSNVAKKTTKTKSCNSKRPARDAVNKENNAPIEETGQFRYFTRSRARAVMLQEQSGTKLRQKK